jgi:succinate dehydrogenase / fumarate reductase flavoprotein subunit
MAVYLDFAANTERYGTIEASKQSIQNPNKKKLEN